MANQEQTSTPIESLLTVEDLAEILRKSPHSLKSDLVRNPECLPPPVRVKGTKRLLWRRKDVDQWLEDQVS